MLNSIRRVANEELWRHSREPLKLPLLKRAVENSSVAEMACMAFQAILKYMGDIPTQRTYGGSEFTDKIFHGPLNHVSEVLITPHKT